MIWIAPSDLLLRGMVPFRSFDDGDVLLSPAVPWGRADSREVPVFVGASDVPTDAEVHVIPNGGSVSAFLRGDGSWNPCPVSVVPTSADIFARVKGLFETERLHGSKVAIFGVGSGGSRIAIELAMAGVGRFSLVDHDRLEPGNIVRHACGLQDVGRFKTKAVRDLILDKNPGAQVHTYETRCAWDNISAVKAILQDVDIVVCATDNRESRTLVNRVALAEGKVVIFGGTFQRAYGGQVIRVTPGASACYQCFVDLLPEMAVDQEISSDDQAAAIAYSDRQVPVEPGLSNDIAPISVMCVKLVILELLRGHPSSFASLYGDLQASIFQWLNRREPGSPYEHLESIDDGAAFRVLAWYPVVLERQPGCAACGDFRLNPRFHGVIAEASDMELFGPP